MNNRARCALSPAAAHRSVLNITEMLHYREAVRNPIAVTKFLKPWALPSTVHPHLHGKRWRTVQQLVVRWHDRVHDLLLMNLRDINASGNVSNGLDLTVDWAWPGRNLTNGHAAM